MLVKEYNNYSKLVTNMFLIKYQDIFGVFTKFVECINYKGKKISEHFIKQLHYKNTLDFNHLQALFNFGPLPVQNCCGVVKQNAVCKLDYGKPIPNMFIR